MKYKAALTRQVVEILKLIVREQTPMGVTRIADHLRLHKSTAYGILCALVDQGYVVKDDRTKTYAMGKQLLAFIDMIAGRTGLAAAPYVRQSGGGPASLGLHNGYVELPEDGNRSLRFLD